MSLTKNNFESLTNVAYAIAGIALLFLAPVSQIWVMALLLVVLAYGSYLGHAKGGKLWALDWAGMGLVFGGLIAYAQSASPINQILAALVGGGFAYALEHYEDYLDKNLRYAAIILLWILAVVNLYDYGHNVVPGVIIFAIAIAIRQYGEKHDDSENEIMHGWWHIITAIGFVLLITL